MKFNLKSYFEPTPKNLRKIGDTLLALSATALPALISNEKTMKILGIILFSMGILGKFLTNFFTDEPEKP